jgi:hypothetical protein
MRRLRLPALASLAFCLLLSLPAAAQEVRERRWHGTLYVGQWISSRLLDVPRRLGAGDVETEDAYYASAIASRVLVPDLRTDIAWLAPIIDGSSLELEAQLGWHLRLQRHGEATLSLAWRSRDLVLPLGGLRVNVAAAEGLSYALSRPAFEGVVNEVRPRQFLNYLAFEFEVSHPAMPGVALVPRLHHRSGIFGLIAPQGSGSNFLGVGLRIDLN